MRSPFYKILFCGTIFFIGVNFSYAQVRNNPYSPAQCPPNIDFELGNFANWECKTGSVSAPGNVNTITWTGTGQSATQHQIIPSTNTGLDFYGQFPLSCPNGSNYSVKLGNNGGNHQAEGLFYTYAIPASATNFSIVYRYAVVLQSPNHNPWEQPRFRSLVINLTDNDTLDCVQFDFNPGGSLPGFQLAPNSPPAPNQVMYKNWTPITLDLSAYAGKTIQLQFMTSDCIFVQHFGYAYVDVDANCDGAIIGSTICQGDTTVTLTAPYGFDTYTWYSDNTFSQVVGTGQILTLNPAPNSGAILPVIITPFPGYGCVDTVYATLSLAPRPVSDAGSDALACKWQQMPLGGPPNSSYTYQWTPAPQVSNAAIANPTGFITEYRATEFIVKTTDPATGCFSYDTVNIFPKAVDTSLTVTGKTDYCFGENFNTVLSIKNTSTNVQWYNTNTPVGGANAISYTPTTTGTYWASFNQLGCTDSTRQVLFDVFPLPVADFGINTKDTQCVTSNSFTFTNNSSITDGTSLSYLWTFSDGSSSTQPSPVKSFNTTGTYSVKLLASSIHACKDSLSDNFYVMPNAKAAFSRDSACTNRPIHFTNLTNENGSPAVTYAWDFGNSLTSSLKNPLPFTYSPKGTYVAKLVATALGCETDVQTVTQTILANDAKYGITYPSKIVPLNYTQEIYARDSVGTSYQWSPATQLNSTTIKAPMFTAQNDVKYTITISDVHTCITIDTLQMLVLKKPGWYLPNAFTPNGDGLNDIIRPYLIGMKLLKKFSIYNRLGNLIFSSNREGEGWDGTYKGRKLDSGAFVWTLEYIDTAGKTVMQKGTIMLIR